MGAQYEVQLPIFEGPLDLLLSLVEREELDITTIALAQVTDQYLAYMAQLERHKVREVSGFLAVAAKLILIKSQALLPRPPVLAPEEEDVGEDLVRQLKAYKRFKEIATLLQEREQKGLRGYVRIAPRPQLDPQADVGNVTLADLMAYLQEALQMKPGPPAANVVTPITVTIDQQITRIESEITHRDRVRFREFLSAANTRVEIIVTLLAVLELIKQKRATVHQDHLFGEIFITRETVEADAAANDGPAAAPATG